jgi:hypothetical protein
MIEFLRIHSRPVRSDIAVNSANANIGVVLMDCSPFYESQSGKWTTNSAHDCLALEMNPLIESHGLQNRWTLLLHH